MEQPVVIAHMMDGMDTFACVQAAFLQHCVCVQESYVLSCTQVHCSDVLPMAPTLIHIWLTCSEPNESQVHLLLSSGLSLMTTSM